MLGLHRSKIMPLMRKLVLALFLAAALAFPTTVSEPLAELEQKVKVHELEQRVASLQAGTVKEAQPRGALMKKAPLRLPPCSEKEECYQYCVRVVWKSNAILGRRAQRAFT